VVFGPLRGMAEIAPGGRDGQRCVCDRAKVTAWSFVDGFIGRRVLDYIKWGWVSPLIPAVDQPL
jgi:hypothetical protein